VTLSRRLGFHATLTLSFGVLCVLTIGVLVLSLTRVIVPVHHAGLGQPVSHIGHGPRAGRAQRPVQHVAARVDDEDEDAVVARLLAAQRVDHLACPVPRYSASCWPTSTASSR
jgi:hypothetical protein